MKSDINFSYLIFLSVVAALGGFLFGYDAAVISGTISQVTEQFGLDQIQTGWFVGCALVGSIIGVLFAGKLSDRCGRKVTMLIAALFFSVSGIGCAFTGSFDQLVIARILGGVGIGVVSIVSPLYISEVSIARYRGRLVSLYQLAVTLGFLGAYLANYQLLHYSQSGAALGDGWMHTIFVSEVWRGMLGLSGIPSLLFFVVVLFIPESPRWLVLRKYDERALGVFQRIYLSVQDAQGQLDETKSVVQSETKSDWKFLLQPGIFKAVLIGAAIAILGQFMGVNAVLYYGPSIFEEAGLSGGDALFSQVLVGLVNAVTTVIAVFIIDKVGRKKLVYYGVSGMVLSAQQFLAVLLLVLCILLCHIHFSGHLCPVVRDVSHSHSRYGHVHCRLCPLGWHLSGRTAYSLDAPKSYPRRNILAVCPHVCALHADCMETDTRDYRQVA